MKKSEAVRLLGGSVAKMAKALGVSKQRVYQLPEDLDQGQADRVIGAAIRNGYMPAPDPANSDAAAA